jgi:three-Cys-motif partner protein
VATLDDYQGREQAYVKHTFLELYLEALAHKVASTYPHIVYVDGFAGPWQSVNENFRDTSFGIALNALRKAKESWKPMRDVRMSALLVERDATAYAALARVPERYPDIAVKTYQGDFLSVLPQILNDIPSEAFAFFLIDPKGWRIKLRNLRPLLARERSEVVFNFMFDFINRAAGIADPAVIGGLDDLMPYGDFRLKLADAEAAARTGLTPDERKAILAEAFGQSLERLGRYDFVAETTVLRPVSDRPLYCLFYATRHPRGVQVFRDCQVKALTAQSSARAQAKVVYAERSTGQKELFQSLHDMGRDELKAHLATQREAAERKLLALVPQQPSSIVWQEVWPQILAQHVVRLTEVNKIASRLRKEGKLLFPNWEKGKQVPQPGYRVQRT